VCCHTAAIYSPPDMARSLKPSNLSVRLCSCSLSMPTVRNTTAVVYHCLVAMPMVSPLVDLSTFLTVITLWPWPLIAAARHVHQRIPAALDRAIPLFTFVGASRYRACNYCYAV